MRKEVSSGPTGNDSSTIDTNQLLSDIREIFAQSGKARLSSKELVEKLLTLSEQRCLLAVPVEAVSIRSALLALKSNARGNPPWQSALNWLARQLRPLGITTRNIRDGELRAKGYDLADFSDAFSRLTAPEPGEVEKLLPPSPSQLPFE